MDSSPREPSLLKQLLTLGIPMTIEMFLISAYSLVDLLFVQELGREAVAAVGAAGSILILAIAISLGLSIVFGAMVSRRVGEGDGLRASVATTTAMALSVGLGVVVSVLGYFTAPWAVGALGLEGEVGALTSSYLQLRYVALPIGFALFGLNACIRSAGEAKAALRFLLVANILNIALDPMFIFGFGPIPALGVDGSAIATGIAQLIALAYQLRVLSRGIGPLTFKGGGLSVDWPLMGIILKHARSAIPQAMVRMASSLFLTALVTYQGEAALAGYTAAVRVHLTAILPAFGLGNAVSTLVGQRLGSGQSGEAEKVAWMGAGISGGYMLILALFFWWQGEWILGFLAPDQEVLFEASRCLLYFCLSYPLNGAGIALDSAFNGAGETKVPLALNLINRWGVQLGLAFVLTVLLDYGTGAIWRSANISDLTMFVCAVLVFRRGKWKSVLI